MTTFGFEAEFQNNVGNMARALHQAGVSMYPDIHNYMCECEACAYDADTPADIRVKRDSSCGGEVISRILDDSEWDEAVRLMTVVQDCALDTDTVPGISAGFHVHVAKPRRLRDRGRLVHAFILWEDAIAALAGGRWPDNRGWNTSLGSVAWYSLGSLVGSRNPLDTDDTLHRLDRCDIDTTFYETLADCAQCDWDRHSTLALSGRHPTVEFRLWNSTRSAWRMELWCRLSVALRSNGLIAALLEGAGGAVADREGRTVDAFVDIVTANANGRLSELITRQRDYRRSLESGDIAISELVAA